MLKENNIRGEVMMSYKKGYTLMETLLAIMVLGTVFALTVSVTKNMRNNTNMAIKKASQTMNEVVENLLSDMNFYSGADGFGDLRDVKLSNGFPVGGDEKFRKLFRNSLRLNMRMQEGEILLCPILVSSSIVQNDAECFMSEDGLVWGIPDTNFKDKNIVKMMRRDYETAYVPVTVYPNCQLEGQADSNGIVRCENSNSATYFDDNAIVFAVRKDGDIRPYSKLDCKDPSYKQSLQCRAAEIISNTSF